MELELWPFLLGALVAILVLVIRRGDTVVTAKGDNRITDAEERGRDSIWRIW